MMEVDELLIREQVRHTIAAYNAATDRGDLAGVQACFAPDAELQIGRDDPIPAAQIAATLAEVIPDRPDGRPAPTHVHHHVSSTHFVRVSATEARTDSYFAVHTDIGLDHWGRYRDTHVLTESGWRLARRQILVAGSSPQSLLVAP